MAEDVDVVEASLKVYFVAKFAGWSRGCHIVENLLWLVDYDVEEDVGIESGVDFIEDFVAEEREVVFEGGGGDVDVEDTMVDISAESVAVDTGAYDFSPEVRGSLLEDGGAVVIVEEHFVEEVFDEGGICTFHVLKI